MSLAMGDAIGLARALVGIDSRNPSLVSGAPGEGQAARALADVLEGWGIAATVQEVRPGRPNVVAIIPGSVKGSRSAARSLLFNGHLDTVGVEGMTHAPFGVDDRGRLYGRGAADMKGGIAAMCAAAARLKGTLRGDLLIAAVMDEEWQSLGTSALLASGVRADAAIVTEPTGLAMMPAHRGFVWLEITVHGRAAHGSRWEIGLDAIRLGGLLLAELDRMDAEDLPRSVHSLLGRPSLHAGSIEGGIGLSTYPDRCVLRVERRTIPGETVDDVEREMNEACARVHARRSDFQASVDVLFAQPPSDVPPDADIVRALGDVLTTAGAPAIAGMSAWTDAALLNQAGIPAICFGPGDMGLAHAAEEYIETEQIEQATEALVALARDWCS